MKHILPISLFLNENKDSSRTTELINTILDKIHKDGQSSLSNDERLYFQQYREGNIDKDLENWLLSTDDLSLDYNGKKVLYNEFEDDEDIMYNQGKLIKIISNSLNKKPFSTNADWSGYNVWNLKNNNNFVGTFLVIDVDDDKLLLLKRELDDEDNYIDEVLHEVKDSKELNKILMLAKQNRLDEFQIRNNM